MQCENEPIAQSTADIAADMRALVRERIAAGESDDEIRSFFRERYGDFVLFRPPWDARTWALWAAPLILVGLGLATGEWWLERRTMSRAAVGAYLTSFIWHAFSGTAEELGVSLGSLDAPEAVPGSITPLDRRAEERR